jgi:SpoIVB peptidase S55
MTRRSFAVAVLLAAFCTSCAGAAQAPKFKLDETKYMPAGKLTRGMKGYGLTVFEGTKPEKFNIEIIGVMRNVWDVGSDMILIRCSGKNLEHTGIAAGMSGSPIYVNDKMIGALAYGFSFAKAPIAGVTPIAEMLSLLDQPPMKKDAAKPATAIKLGKPLNVLDKEFGEVKFARRSLGVDPTSAGIMELTPIAVPVRLSGLGPPSVAKRLLKMFGPELKQFGLMPVLGGSVGGKEVVDTQLRPGSVVSAQMVWGDLDWSGIGTVTEVRGKRVYAFGHPMWSEADVTVPMSAGYIYTFMPSFSRTFKIGSGTKIVGTIDTDRATGIAGTIGATGKSVKVRVSVTGWPEKTTRVYKFQTLRHQSMTPYLIGVTSSGALFKSGGPPDELTARYKITIKPEGRKPLVIENIESGQDGWAAAARVYIEVRAAVGQLTLNQFERIYPESVDIDVKFEPVRRAAVIETIAVDRTNVRRGETVRATVEVRKWKAGIVRQTVEVKVPVDAPLGAARLTVCGGSECRIADRMDSPARFKPENIEQVLELATKQYRKDRIYARLSINKSGVAIKGKELPQLPLSMLSLLSARRRTGVSTMRSSLVSSAPSTLVLTGSQTITINVEEAK